MKSLLACLLSCTALTTYGATICPPGPAKAHVAFGVESESMSAAGFTVRTTRIVSKFVSCTPESFNTEEGVGYMERAATAALNQPAHLISIIPLAK